MVGRNPTVRFFDSILFDWFFYKTSLLSRCVFLTITTTDFEVSVGIEVTDDGITVTGDITVTDDGITVTGGVTVEDGDVTGV